MAQDDQSDDQRTDGSRNTTGDDRREIEKERETASEHGTDKPGEKRRADELE